VFVTYVKRVIPFIPANSSRDAKNARHNYTSLRSTLLDTEHDSLGTEILLPHFAHKFEFTTGESKSKMIFQNSNSPYSSKSETSDIRQKLRHKYLRKTRRNAQTYCFLTYDSTDAGRLLVEYSRQKNIPTNAVAYWTSIENIPKSLIAKQTELIRGVIGSVQNRKRYLSGWCQFISLAKQYRGRIQILPQHGMNVNIYGHSNNQIVTKCDGDVSDWDGVVAVWGDALDGVPSMALVKFLKANNENGD